MESAGDVVQSCQSRQSRRRKWTWIIAIAVVLVIAIAVGVGAGVGLSRKSSGSDKSSVKGAESTSAGYVVSQSLIAYSKVILITIQR
jgi:flagellar basal body-associated protein FliL